MLIRQCYESFDGVFDQGTVPNNHDFDSDIQLSIPNKNIHFQRSCLKFRPLVNVLALILYVSTSCLTRSNGSKMQVRGVSIKLFPATG